MFAANVLGLNRNNRHVVTLWQPAILVSSVI